MQPRPLAAMADPRGFIHRHTRVSPVPLCPQLVLYQADALTTLWETTEHTLGSAGIDVPFWAVPWPGGTALARYLLDTPQRVEGRRVLDLGTGSGLCAIAAARAGAATVRAVDPDPLAAAAAALNGDLNGVAVDVSCEDPLDAPPPGDWDVILAADLWYERFLARRVTPWLRAAAGRGALVLGGDPGRAYLPRTGLVPLATHCVPTSLDLEQHTRTRTRVFRILPATHGHP